MSQVLFDPEKHEYSNSSGVLFPSVTKIIALDGLCDFSHVDEEVRIRAMDRGTSVHWLARLEDEGALDYRKVPIGLRPYRKGWNDWKKASGFVPELIEYPFISHYGYAGTIDRYGRLPKTLSYPNGSRAVVDLKTGEISEWVRYQLVAYAMRMHPTPAVAMNIRRIAVALRQNGTYSVREFPQNTWAYDWSRFMQAKRRVDGGHVDHERTGN